MATKTKVEVKKNPQLKQRVLAGDKIALYLEYYLGRTQEPRLDESGKPMYYQSGKMAGKPMYKVTHARKKEELKLYLNAKPRTPEEREKNNKTLLTAEAIRYEREQQRLNDVMGYRVNTHKKDNMIVFFDTYVADYTKRDIRNVKSAIERFKTFLRGYRPMCATKKTAAECAEIQKKWDEAHEKIKGLHPLNQNEFYRFNLKPGEIDKEMVQAYVAYLQDHSEGEGAATSYARFKKVMAYAAEKGVLKSNPCKLVKSPKVDDGALVKDVLTADEISRLIATKYPGQNSEIQRAFIFTLFTGCRWCDVKDLRYSNIDYTTSKLRFTQKKTEGHSAHAEVIMPLREDLLQLIGSPEERGKAKTDLLFTLPSHTMCNKALKHWTARAGIDKKVTWHCGRHSFATNVLTAGANVRVVADLLGHAGLQYVSRYARAVDEAKKAAVDSLPSIQMAL